MNRLLVPLALMLLVASIGGCRELSNPKSGYIVVSDKDSAVFLQTRDLEGSGYIKAYTTTGEWTEIYRNPAGAFSFLQALPEEAWHCATRLEMTYGDKRGCVAALRVGDEKGFFYTPKSGRIYVCTEDYVQGGDRKHCGTRSIEGRSFFTFPLGSSDWEKKGMNSTKSHPVTVGDYARNWEGDSAQRLFSGFHEWTNTNNAWDPALPGDTSGSWQEWPYYEGVFGESTFTSGNMYSVDIGVSRVFIPWKGQDYVPGSFKVQDIKNTLDDLGLAEILIDRLKDNPLSQSIYTQNAARWLNTLQNIWTRGDVSPEFHFRVNEAGDRQMCLVQYVMANNRVNGRPDSWWRFDQGIAALFVQWFGLGDCRTHPARIQYCGSVEMKDSVPTFTIDPDSVSTVMEPYGTFKPLCRKRFHPEFEARLPEMLIGPAQEAVTMGLNQLVAGFKFLLGGDIRRLEMTPTGVYLVLAETFLDNQYGIGDSVPVLEGEPKYGRVQSAVTLSSVPATGITRPVQ